VRRPRYTDVPSVAPGAGRNAQDQGARRVAFSLDTFFWPSKRLIRRERIGTAEGWPGGRTPGMEFAVYPACGVAPRSKTSAALSGTLVEFSNI